MKPICLDCGKPLRAYQYRDQHPGHDFGGYGDNLFCGLNCGYHWGLTFAQKMVKDRGDSWLENYRRALTEIVTRKAKSDTTHA